MLDYSEAPRFNWEKERRRIIDRVAQAVAPRARLALNRVRRAAPGRRVMAPSAKALAVTKLASSGLNFEAAKRFGIEVLTRADAQALGGAFQPLASLKLNYFAPSGRTTDFFRVRYLEEPTGFAGLVADQQRYVQPPDTTAEIYWPRSDAWAELAGDAAAPVHLTEGELKACCATLHGFPTIAVGGVWSWRSAKRGVAIMPTMTPAGFVWKDRVVYIVFDSDSATKPQVAAARLALCDALTSLGARPAVVTLTPVEGLVGKTGLDDFIVAHGKDAYLHAIMNAVPFASARGLWQLNSEVTYVRDPGLVVVIDSGRRLAPHAFTTHAYANRHYVEQQIKPDGGVKIVKRPLAKSWLEWEQRSELERLEYSPGQERIVNGTYNLWKGWGCKPKRGDTSPWRLLLDFIFGANTFERTWFERWAAYPIQRPGTKLFTSAFVWGVVQGTGKSQVGYSLGKVYGSNFSEIGEEELHAAFNDWAEAKQFVMGDDVTSGEKRGRGNSNSFIEEKMKRMITQKTLRINTKFVPTFTVRDCVNYYFTANQPDAMFIEDTDRRTFVHEVVGDPLPKTFYDAYRDWIDSDDGPPALFYHLLRVDLGDFDPTAHAPWTAAKRSMALDNKSDLGAWVARLKHHPEPTLALGGAAMAGDLFTTQELLLLYDPERKSRVTPNGMGRELKRAGFRQVHDGDTISTAHGPQRLYAIRDAARWLEAKSRDIALHYNARFGPKPGKKAKF